jgi:hypothetical protein
MSHAIHCRQCETYVWPPHEATGSAFRTHVAAYELALQHVRERGHTDVDVVPGCYHIGDGPRPNAFDGETVEPEDVAMPDKTKLVRATAGAAGRLRSVADDLENGNGDPPRLLARQLREYANAVESNITAHDDDHDHDNDP